MKKIKIIFFILAGILSFFFFFQTKKLEIKNLQRKEFEITGKEIEAIGAPSPFSGISCSNFSKRAWAIVISQEIDSFPIFGVSQADLVIEAPFANPKGVTRLLVFFQCKAPEKIGPIRSLRPHMVDLAKGFDAILVSWGACENAHRHALSLKADWLSPVKYVRGQEAFFRDPNREAPHNSFASILALEKVAKKIKLRTDNEFSGYLFSKNLEKKDLPYVAQVNIDAYFYQISWRFSQQKKAYLRYFNEKEVRDPLSGEPVFARNLILMKTEIGTLEPGVAKIKVIGEGEARIYQEGQFIEGKWKKENPKQKLAFFDKDGKEINFLEGPTWIEIVDRF